MVAETAEQICSTVYAALMQKNEWYTAWKAAHPKASGEALERIFVKKFASSYVQRARATLASMLGQEQYSNLHQEISDALILDNGFKRKLSERNKALSVMHSGK